ncbi:MAG: DNA replication/repair protein RecF [Clostridiales bacterium]|nr:DNA replication/repair protein RecF [Clostridiales bacterium]
MKLQSLRLTDFRNHADTILEPCEDINLLLGKNAQGKTNLLESIYLLSRGQSFRARRDAELIRFGCDAAQLDAKLSDGKRDCMLSIRLGARRQTLLNGIRQKRASDAAGLFHVVLFRPEDLGLVRGASSQRRRFLDTALSQLRPLYGELVNEYTRLHAHIVRILRDREPAMLGTLDDFYYRLCCVGARMIPYRASFCTALTELTEKYHADISGGEALSVRYETVSTVRDLSASPTELGRALWEHYIAHKEASLRSGNVLTGPHRDDLVFTIDGQNAREYASQGQVRTAALACKLAEREIFTRADRTPPVLLLDDVLSELDAARRAYVLRGITGGQVFITACDVKPGEVAARRVFTISGGRVCRQEGET